MGGDAVRAIRISRSMSQADYASSLGVSRSLIEAVENGRRPVSRHLRIKIAQVFGTGEDTLQAIERAKQSELLAP